MKKVLVTASNYSKYCAQAKQKLEKAGFQVDENTTGKRYTEEQLIQIVPEYDAAIVGMDPWTKKVISNATKMKIIAKFGVGYDNIDVQAAKENGIVVTYAKGQNAVSVAELAFTLIMNVLKNIPEFDTDTKNGIWDRELQHEIQSKTIGLYGFGNIAQRLAKMLQGFSVNLIAYDPYFNYEIAKELNVKYVEQDKLISTSDILSLHLPGFKENTHIINQTVLANMKKGVILINTSRGNLVDLNALNESIQNNHLLGAGLDCYEKEPVQETLELFNNKRIVCTPHCGGKTWEAYERISNSTAQNIIDIFNGKTPKNII